MKNHNIKAALFDLDGVIVFTDKYHYLAWKRLADERGWEFDENVNNRLRGIPRLASLEEILKHNHLELPAEEKLALAEIKNGYYIELLSRINEGDIYPGAVDFIRALRQRGIRIALCSSSKNAQPVLDRLGLAELFDVIVTGHDICNAKPDPEIFLLAAKKLRMPAFHCVVFEDAKAGIQGALAAKMRTVGVGNREETEELAACFIERYEEIDIDTFLESGAKQPMPVDENAIIEVGFNPKDIGHIESLFALGNGYMGLRGTYDETDEGINNCNGMYINGIYADYPYDHLSKCIGFARVEEFTINLTDWRIFNLYIDGEKACYSAGNIQNHVRRLDMQKGCIERTFLFETATGKQARVQSIRIVNMNEVHSAEIHYCVTPLNFDGPIVIESQAEKITQIMGGTHSAVVTEKYKNGTYSYVQRVSTTKQQVACAITHTVVARDYTEEISIEGNVYSHRFIGTVKANEEFSVCKFVAFCCTMDAVPEEAMEDIACDRAVANKQAGFVKMAEAQKAFWAEHWKCGDVIIQGNAADQQAVRYSLFQLKQQLATVNQCSIGATGLTGPGYSGKVFWDTEMYLMPYYNFTNPESQKELMMYRYRTLDRARERAKEFGTVGAMYPWCGISGEETSIIFEASVAEYHLQSDIAYAIWRYYDSTGDRDFFYQYGAEMVFETARYMAHRGCFVEANDGKFCINVVCGPDEYACGVNNNLYTNLMVQFHLQFALNAAKEMQIAAPERYQELARKCELTEEELALWQRAAENMYYKYNEKYGIYEQDDSYVRNDPVDMDLIPKNVDIRGDYHPLDLWRIQVSKQADVVLANFILGNKFTFDEKLRNYDYYEPRCNHGSSLSSAIHAIMAAELGKPEAYEFFRCSAYMDLSDFKKNTDRGIHIACLGGNWMTVVNGYLGMRHYPEGIMFSPHIPQAWTGYNCKIVYKKATVDITVGRDQAEFVLIDGEQMKLKIYDQDVVLSAENRGYSCGLM
ncbi:MAG: beta-phosphoglucomutase [Ruminococcaceae bacterium]|nr:beta-phosphoglucomutase [Oscillospiraceae bacterium]